MKKYTVLIILLLVSLTSCGKQDEGVVEENTKAVAEINSEASDLIEDLIEEIEQEDIDTDDSDITETSTNEAEDTDSSALDLSTAAFTGNGAEPFWSFSASGSTLILLEPSDSGPMLATSYSGIIMTNIGGNINLSGSGVNLDLTLGTCLDGMSDIVYDYSSEFLAGAKYYEGCANVD